MQAAPASMSIDPLTTTAHPPLIKRIFFHVHLTGNAFHNQPRPPLTPDEQRLDHIRDAAEAFLVYQRQHFGTVPTPAKHQAARAFLHYLNQPFPRPGTF